MKKYDLLIMLKLLLRKIKHLFQCSSYEEGNFYYNHFQAGVWGAHSNYKYIIHLQ